MPHIDRAGTFGGPYCTIARKYRIPAIVLSSYDELQLLLQWHLNIMRDYLLKAEIDSQKLLAAVDNYYFEKK